MPPEKNRDKIEKTVRKDETEKRGIRKGTPRKSGGGKGISKNPPPKPPKKSS